MFLPPSSRRRAAGRAAANTKKCPTNGKAFFSNIIYSIHVVLAVLVVIAAAAATSAAASGNNEVIFVRINKHISRSLLFCNASAAAVVSPLFCPAAGKREKADDSSCSGSSSSDLKMYNLHKTF